MLPRPSTSFVGRESELAQVRGLLDRTRLLTLTGPGGCGKTRLVIELASRVEAFPDGVHFVSLSAVRDPALVPVEIARSIGLQDARGTPLLEHLGGLLAEREVLLILDNFEQVLAAGGFVADLLGVTARTRILVTSRAPLRLSWEQEFAVPPLHVPGRGSALSAASLGECESVQLFVARAGASVAGFAVTGKNAAAIADIVERLDGLPLAIELAAAWVKLLSPEAISARLAHSLGLLVGGRRDMPDRQRTLRAAIGWSYDLLTEPARGLLAVCSVFPRWRCARPAGWPYRLDRQQGRRPGRPAARGPRSDPRPVRRSGAGRVRVGRLGESGALSSAGHEGHGFHPGPDGVNIPRRGNPPAGTVDLVGPACTPRAWSRCESWHTR